MVSLFTPYCRLGFTPRFGWGQSSTNHCYWSSLQPGLPRLTAMCEPERHIHNVKELADGSLMYSFGSSHSSGNAKRANSFSLSHSENVTSIKNSLPKRMPSNFKKQSPIPITAVRKRGKSYRVPRQQDTGSRKVQDNFDSEKVTGEIDKVNHNKRGYGISGRSSSAYVKRFISSPKGRDSPEIKKSYNSSVVDEDIKKILDRPMQNRSYDSSSAADHIRRIRATISKLNSASGEKKDNRPSKLKFRKSTGSFLPLLSQNAEKTKGEYKENGSKRHSSIQDEKMPTRIFSSIIGPRKQIYEKTSKIVDKPQEKNKGEFKENGSKRHSSIQDEKMPTRIVSLTRVPRKQIYEKSSKIVEKPQPETSVLSRPPSKFVRRSPVPLSAIKQYIRPVPGTQESESTSTEESGGISRDSNGTSTCMENGSVLKDLPSLSEGQQNDLNKLKLPELKKMAKSYGLKGYSTLRKGELLELLRITTKQS